MRLPPFQALLNAHRGDVYRYLVAVAGPAEADDCFQETWIAALRAYPRLRRADNLRAWVLRIAHSKAIDAHRARAKRATPMESIPERSAASSAEEAAVLDGEPALWEAVRALAPRQRTAVFCRSVLGMPYPELAALLECSEDAARRSHHDGLKRLKQEWTPQ